MPPAQTPTAPERLQSSGFDSEFPLPSEVSNFKELREGQINYETSLSLEEIVDFYRKAFTDQGLSVRTLLTVINETALSIVTKGSPNGKLVVVQAVVLNSDSVNVNVRYE